MTISDQGMGGRQVAHLVTALEMVDRTMLDLQNRIPLPSEPMENEIDGMPLFDVDDAMDRAGFPDKFLRRPEWQTPDFVKRYAPPADRVKFRDFRGLFLTGPTGRKKTASLALMARDWLTTMGRRASRSWRFVTFPELCVQLQVSWDDRGPLDIIDDLARVPLLIVDDMGVEKTTDFVLQSAYLLFNKREQAELPTYGTSNLSIDDLRVKLDDRIVSRIRGMCDVVPVDGEDQRVKR